LFNAQKNEISFLAGRSINVSDRILVKGPYNHSKLIFTYSNTYSGHYKYQVSQKHRFFASSSFDYTSANYIHNVYQPNALLPRTIRIHQINSQFVSLGLGLHKELDLIEDKLIFDIHIKGAINFQSNKVLNESFDTVTFTFTNYTEHHYELTSRPNNNRMISFDCGFDFKFYLKRNFYLNIGARFHRIFNESKYYYHSQSYNLDGEPDEGQFGSHTVDGYKDGIGKVNTILMTPRFGLSYRF
jgi:hypothetical protein